MRPRMAIGWALFLLSFPACTGGGESPADTLEASDLGPDVRATIGPLGGTVTLPGGGRLEIPPGALAEEAEIVASAAEAPAGLGFRALGGFVRLEPAGLRFRIPARVVLPFDAAAAGPGSVEIVWSADGQPFVGLDSTRDAILPELRAPVEHFSVGGPAEWDEAPICCATPEDGERRMSEGQCTELGGSVLGGGELCRRVCCSYASPEGDVVTLGPKAACDALASGHPAWGVSETSTEDCEGCCEDDWTRKELSLCARPAATAQACDVGCCSVGGADATGLPQGRCKELGGEVTGPLSSCYGCCSDGKWKPLSECTEPAADPSDCEWVCCEISAGVFDIEGRKICQTTGVRIVGDDGLCVDVVCCERRHKEGDQVSVTITAGEGSECLALQAEHPGDTFQTTPPDPDTGCVACCPDTWALLSLDLAPSACPSGFGVPKSLCDPVCCLLGEGILPVPLARGACAEGGGQEVAGEVGVCGCQVDEECAPFDLAVGDCTVSACVEHACQDVPAPAEAPCDDGDPCTLGDQCTAEGQCQAGAPMVCATPPGQPACFQEGYCDDASGECVYKPLEAAACWSDAMCPAEHVCTGTCRCQKPCEDDAGCPRPDEECRDPWCTAGFCAPEGAPAPEGGPCEDGDDCTWNDQCDAYGTCQGTPYPEGECPVCCWPDFNVVPEKACPVGEKAQLEVEQCDRVCCQVGEAFRFQARGECVAGQGQVIPDEDCPVCEIHEDCWPRDPDNGDCATLGCDDGVCVPMPEHAGKSCSDGDGCTWQDVCDGAGKCAGTAVPCDQSPYEPACQAGGSCEAGQCRYESMPPGFPCEAPTPCYLFQCSVFGTCDKTLACPLAPDPCVLPVCRGGSGYPEYCDHDYSQCTEVCCKVGEQFSLSAPGACQGTVVGGPSDCAPACCRNDLTDEWTSRPGAACVEAPWSVEQVDPGLCNPVCCDTAITWEVISQGSCLAAGGTVWGDPAACDTTCCRDPAGLVLDLPGGACQALQYEIVDAGYCVEACCDSNYKVEKLGNCVTLGGFPTSDSKCEEVCCYQDDHLGRRARGRCSGWVMPDSLCDSACCWSEAEQRLEMQPPILCQGADWKIWLEPWDPNPDDCMTPVVTENFCSGLTPEAAGKPCAWDGDPCTRNDQCDAAGQCVGQPTTLCDDRGPFPNRFQGTVTGGACEGYDHLAPLGNVTYPSAMNHVTVVSRASLSAPAGCSAGYLGLFYPTPGTGSDYQSIVSGLAFVTDPGPRIHSEMEGIGTSPHPLPHTQDYWKGIFVVGSAACCQAAGTASGVLDLAIYRNVEDSVLVAAPFATNVLAEDPVATLYPVRVPVPADRKLRITLTTRASCRHLPPNVYYDLALNQPYPISSYQQSPQFISETGPSDFGWYECVFEASRAGVESVFTVIPNATNLSAADLGGVWFSVRYEAVPVP